MHAAGTGITLTAVSGAEQAMSPLSLGLPSLPWVRTEVPSLSPSVWPPKKQSGNLKSGGVQGTGVLGGGTGAGPPGRVVGRARGGEHGLSHSLEPDCPGDIRAGSLRGSSVRP